MSLSTHILWGRRLGTWSATREETRDGTERSAITWRGLSGKTIWLCLICLCVRNLSIHDGLSVIFEFENYWECVEECIFMWDMFDSGKLSYFWILSFSIFEGVRCCTVCNPLGGYHLNRPLRPITWLTPIRAMSSWVLLERVYHGSNHRQETTSSNPKPDYCRSRVH